MKRTNLRSIAIAAVGASLAIGLVGCSTPPTPPANTPGSTAPTSPGTTAPAGSTTLYVSLANHVWSTALVAAIPEFEKATGLKVEVTQTAETQLSAYYNTQLNAGTSQLDVMMYRPLQEGKLFATNEWLADLSARVTADAAWDWGDFQAGPVQTVTYDKMVVGVPIITEREVLYYRKDLLAKAGLKVPTTLDELKAAAEAIYKANPGTAGFIARTDVAALVTQLSSFLYSYGGDWMDANGKASVGTPEAIKAYTLYSSLIHDYGPANVATTMNWPDAMAIFTQGGAAFYTEADSLYTNATDPAKSKVSDTVGFAPFPAGPAGAKPYNVPSWGLAINANSKNQDNAWKFIAWATSKEMALAIQKAGVPSARNSVWANPESTANYPADLSAAINASLPNGVGHDRPLVTDVAAARAIVGKPAVVGITGGDVAAAAAQAQTDFQAFLDAQ